jgi:pimeloyl-ACP methyl ester carboxylesterase/DNA-binding SARP family transcriptional activator
VSDVPEVRFARASGSSIAYQVFGGGPVTICTVPPMAQNIELAWGSPRIREMLEGVAAFSRYVVFDKRGTGMSDRGLDIPALDERVDELTAVMDAADVERAFIYGLSEGGPMAIMFAATYPERVEGLVLEGTGASLLTDEQRAMLRTPEGLAAAAERQREFTDRWGTPDSMTLARFAPSLLADREFVEWWPRYERQAASRDALAQLFHMNGDMDARGVIHRVECPVLVLHRIGDPVVPIERARETFRLFDEVGADVRLVELPGDDHYTFAGDLGAVVREIERFTTGSVRARPARRFHRVTITTMGRFEVDVDGERVPTSAWGSKRARTLLKRLIVGRGWPVTRDELVELLWPGEDSDRLSARLSVQLSAVRRILHGAVIADRAAIRLDLDAVDVDVERWFANDDDAAIVDGYAGELLPDDRYDDWSGPLRDEMRARFVSAARRVADASDPDRTIGLMRRVLVEDPFDEPSHHALVAALHADGRLGEATAAHAAYVASMEELGVTAADWDSIVTS